MLRRWLSRDNFYALLLCLILVTILIMSASQSPMWIYQGF